MNAVKSTSFRREFPQDEAIIYLNHAGVGPIPLCVARVITTLAETMVRYGASRYGQLEQLEVQARQRCAQLIRADSEQTAFVRNTSEGLSMVALGLTWHPGDEVVTTDQEFPTNAVIWLRELERCGGTVHRVPSRPDGRVEAVDLLERVNSRTRVVAVSSVQFGTGTAVDLAQLGAALRQRDVLLVVDAIQSLGVLPMDVMALGIDALAADGHKWLLAPEGCGILYLSEKALAQVEPRIVGWRSVANAGEYDRICTEMRPGVRRFEAGSPNLIGEVALGESVALLLAAGMDEVQNRVRALARAIKDGVEARGCVVHTPMAADGLPPAGIVIFSHPKIPPVDLYQALSREGVYHVRRGRGVRFSPHFYQDSTDVARVLEILDKVIAQRG